MDEYRKRILANNDGSMPREPWQRIPGDAMERLLRKECEASPLVSARYGWTVANVSELEDAAEVFATTAEGKDAEVLARFIVGCDGANSVVRRSLGIALDGGPLYVCLSNPETSQELTSRSTGPMPRISYTSSLET